MFDPNPNAVQMALKSLLGVQPGGGRQSIDDAMLIVNDYKWQYTHTDNGWIFWDAVYRELETLRKERTKL
jgi:hypothetical protein